MNDLLKIFRSQGFADLPSDCRTILQTPPTLNLTEMGSGHYWYYGVSTNLKLVFHDLKREKSVSLIFNVDGISPYNSSPSEFWPILFQIDNMPNLKPMVAAVYYGRGKPPLEPYLTPFVNEINNLLKYGLTVNGHNISFTIKCFICDTPARCFIKGL